MHDLPASRVCLPVSEPLAIVGIGCRFPGGVTGPASFWSLLCAGIDAITEIPRDRWDVDRFYDPDPAAPGKTYARHGGFVENLALFDPWFFGISPREAGHMDPQQRLLMEVAWEAIEDAGLVIDRRRRTPASVFVGISNFDYPKAQRLLSELETITAHTPTGISFSLAANRVSHALNLVGPSVAVDTACSSSLVAVHLACASLRRGECNLALAGGVNALIDPSTYVNFSRLSMLSPDGRSRAFDARANGYVRAEGAGIIVIKPLARAVEDGDRVYAVIRGSGTNQDGRTPGITLPSQVSQEELLWQVYAEATIDPADVGFFEAHGTGTLAGDPIEARAIGSVVGARRAGGHPCYLGSVKTNIGHLESGAGIAGLIKTALVLAHGAIPPNLHFTRPNPEIDFDRLRLRVPTSLIPWPAGQPRVASVSSFGFGGSNAHVVLSAEPPPPEGRGSRPAPSTRAADNERTELFCLSAHTHDSLRALAGRCAEALMGGAWATLPLVDICRAAIWRRLHQSQRLGVAAGSHVQLADRLRAFTRGETAPGMTSTEAAPAEQQRVAFVYCGQGSQWWRMGRRLFADEPVFRETILECDALLRRHADWSLAAELAADERESRLDLTAIAQPAIFALQAALTRLWASWGVRPAAVTGHSVGEVAAAWASGALTLDEAVRVIYHRGRTMDYATGLGGRMLAVGLSADDLAPYLAGHDDHVTIGAINSPASVTLSGDGDRLGAIEGALTGAGVFCRFVPTRYAFHSRHMDGLCGDLKVSLDNLAPAAAAVPFYSTVTGRVLDGWELGGGYWWRNVRQPVRFGDAVAALIDDGCTTFVEVGPHPVLASAISECLFERDRRALVLPSLNRREPDRETMLGSLGALHGIGLPVDWRPLYAERGRFAPFPQIAWMHERFWVQTEACERLLRDRGEHPLLGRRVSGPAPTWDASLDAWPLRYLLDHRVDGHAVFPGAAYIELALAAYREVHGDLWPTLESVRLHKGLFLGEAAATTLRTTLDLDGSTFQVHSRAAAPEASWQLHASGSLTPPDGVPLPAIDLPGVERRCTRQFDAEAAYARLGRAGLEYGPAFQGVCRLSAGEDEAIAEVTLPGSAAAGADRYLSHPSVVDACLQIATVVGVVPEGVGYIPVSAERIRVAGRLTGRLTSHVYDVRVAGRRLRASVRVAGEDGRTLLDIRGLECQTLHATEAGEPFDIAGTLYRYAWVRKEIRAGDEVGVRLWSVLPTTPLVADLAGEAARTLPPPLPASAAACLDAMAARSLRAVLASAASRRGGTFTIETAQRTLGVRPSSLPALAGTISVAQHLGVVTRSGEGWRLAPKRRSLASVATVRHALAAHPGLLAEVTLLGRLARHLPSLLREEVTADAALAPGGDFSMLEHLSQDSPFVRPVTLAAGAILDRVLADRSIERPLRVLECAAPGADLVRWHLPAAGHGPIECVITGVTGALHAGGERGVHMPAGVTLRQIDVDGDLAAQGFTDGSVDLIVLSLAVALTRDPRLVIERLMRLLAGGAIVLLTAYENPRPWRRLLDGVIGGWRWIGGAADGERPGNSPAALLNHLPVGAWSDSGLVAYGADDSERAVLVAARSQGAGGRDHSPRPVDRGAELAARPSAQAAPAPPGRPRGAWLILDDRRGTGSALAARLEQRIELTIVATPGFGFRRAGERHFEFDRRSPDDFAALVSAAAAEPLRAIVCLVGLDLDEHGDLVGGDGAEALNDVCAAIVALVRALMQRDQLSSPRLYLVMRGAECGPGDTGASSPFQSALWGLGRVIANEFPQSRCTLVDLDAASPGGPEGADRDAVALVEELWADDAEDEVAFRNGARYVHRLGRLRPERWEPSRATRDDAGGYRLSAGRIGTLEAVDLVGALRSAPGPGEVEIGVEAAGLNFSDVLKCLGLYPGLGDGEVPLGLECAGIVTRVGSGVSGWKPGDRVMTAAAFGFASDVVVRADMIAPLPPGLDFAAGATIPVAFMTAYYALVHQARLGRGERVLVHSASGGVGLAAIEIARDIGAEVFATAGSPERRAWLRDLGIGAVMDSRSLAFASEVRERTGGEGVDVVLNSLAGPAIDRGLGALRDYGRFVEIGKRDIYADRRVGLLPFSRNLSLFAVDLDMTMRDRPALVAQLMKEIGARLARGRYRPLPFRAVPIARARDALRTMAASRHLGKIVLTTRDHAPLVKAGPAPDPIMRPDRTYLVTGGLGGLGLRIARWLADRGARHLVLAGRRGAASDEAREMVVSLESRGVAVGVAACDVARERDIRALFADMQVSLPPLAGIVHAAGVLDDGLVTSMDGERFRRVLAPKVLGAWWLHRLSEPLPLDFFVLCSSVSSVIGMPGQANYAAANAFLDGLASWRRARGLPAIAINWGYIGEIGMAARNAETVARFENQGLRPISPDEAMALLAWTLQANPPQLATVKMDWVRFGDVFRTWAHSPKFAPLYETDDGADRTPGSPAPGSETSDSTLDALSEDERAERIGEMIAARVARVLGTPLERLDRARPLTEMGFDSLMAVELRNWMDSTLRVSVPAMEVMRGPTVVELTRVVLARMSGREATR